MTNTRRARQWIRVTALGATFCAVIHAQEEVRITETELTPAGEFRIGLLAPAGELLLQTSGDMTTWSPVQPFGTTGGATEVRPRVIAPAAFFRVQSFPDTDDACLLGPVAQALRTTIPYADLRVVFGLAATEAPSPVTQVRHLATAGRDSRHYASAIAVLCIIVEDLQNSIAPTPSVTDLVGALAADLASGNLDGRDSSGNRIPIGSTGVLLKEFTTQDLAAAAGRLHDELSGLRDVEISPAGEGGFTTSAAASWNNFYWGASEWR